MSGTPRFSQEDIVNATRLLAWGLQSKQTPIGNRDYADLIKAYQTSSRSQDALNAVAEGLSLFVLDVDASEGVTLGAQRHSSFAYGITDMRKGVTDYTASLIALGHAAIAAAFFPTAESIESSETQLTALRVGDIRRVLSAAVAELAHRAEENGLDAETDHVWRDLSRLPELPKDRENAKRQRPNLSSLEGLIRVLLVKLVEEGLVAGEPNEKDAMLMARERFRRQLRGRGALVLMDLAQKAAAGRSASNDPADTN